MKKIFFQAITIVALFFTMWFSLSKIDWISILKVKKITSSTEKKLGYLFWDFYKKSDREISNEKITIPLDSILSKICTANNIDKNQIKLHVINSDEINAFALPNKHLVINSGLIIACENEDELAGVMSHEIAHMELNHVMKKLIKEVGFSMLISMTTGNGSSEKTKEVVKRLSSSAYDRKLEKEADIKAVEYLKKTNINAQYFANFLYRIGEDKTNENKYITWISTHPDSKDRAKYIIEFNGGYHENSSPILTIYSWNNLKENLRHISQNNN